MMRALLTTIAAVALALPAVQAAAQTADRLYVMDCGHNAATDQSRWSPGRQCRQADRAVRQLLPDPPRHADAVVGHRLSRRRGRQARDRPVGTATRAKTLAAQLAELGVKPADITLRRGVAHPRRSRRQRRHVPATRPC